MFDKLKKVVQGSYYQANPFDGGKTYASAQQPRAAVTPPPQPRGAVPMSMQVAQVKAAQAQQQHEQNVQAANYSTGHRNMLNGVRALQQQSRYMPEARKYNSAIINAALSSDQVAGADASAAMRDAFQGSGTWDAANNFGAATMKYWSPQSLAGTALELGGRVINNQGIQNTGTNMLQPIRDYSQVAQEAGRNRYASEFGQIAGAMLPAFLTPTSVVAGSGRMAVAPATAIQAARAAQVARQLAVLKNIGIFARTGSISAADTSRAIEQAGGSRTQQLLGGFGAGALTGGFNVAATDSILGKMPYFNGLAQNAIGRTTLAAGANALENVADQTGQNFIAQKTYDPNRKLTDHLGPSAVSGMAFGALMRGVNEVGARSKPMTQSGVVGGVGAKDFDANKVAGRVFDGVDGKPRFEIDDSGAKLMTPQKRLNNKYDLSEIMDHPKLYEQYPDLKTVKVRLADGNNMDDAFAKMSGEKAHYNSQDDSITVYVKNKKNMLHEIQHAVQEREGFAKGASPDEFPDMAELRTGKQQVSGELNTIRRQLETAADLGYSDKTMMEGKTVKQLRQRLAQLENDDARLTKELDNYASPRDRYWKNAAEAEARAVAKRANMPDSERYKMPDGALYHGSSSGDLRGGETGLHLGTRKAAQEALEARIGVRADGKDWDGTESYGNAKIAGQKTLKKLQAADDKYRGSAGFPYSVLDRYGNRIALPEDDFYIKDHPEFMPTAASGGVKMDVSWKPSIRAFTLNGKMSNTPDNPMGDYIVNGRMGSLKKQGKAKSGYYYKNEAEDAGSVSAVVPDGSVVKPAIPRSTFDDSLDVPKDQLIVRDQSNGPSAYIKASPDADSNRKINELGRAARSADDFKKALTDEGLDSSDYQNQFKLIRGEMDLERKITEANPNMVVRPEASPQTKDVTLQGILQQSNKNIKDTGQKMFGSRKDMAKLKNITRDDLANIEAQGERIASSMVTKQRVLGDDAKYTPDMNGNPGVEHYKHLLISAIPGKPAASANARAMFVKEIPDFVQAVKQAKSIDDLEKLGERFVIGETRVDERGYTTAVDYNRRFEIKKQLGTKAYNVLRSMSGAARMARRNPPTDFSWTDKKTVAVGERDTTKPQVHQGLEQEYIRKGGDELGDLDPETIKSTFGFKGMEYGNYVKDGEAKDHLKRFAEGIADMEKSTGVNFGDLIKKMDLGIGFGSRGKSKALAHYEPSTKVINITKKRGADGTFGHEFAHAFDDFLAGSQSKPGVRYASSGIGDNPRIKEAMRDVMRTMREGQSTRTITKGETRFSDSTKWPSIDRYLASNNNDASAALTKLVADYPGTAGKVLNDAAQYAMMKTGADSVDVQSNRSNFWTKSQEAGGYWAREPEMFARVFADYIRIKGEKSGITNNYAGNNWTDSPLHAPDNMDILVPKIDALLKTVQDELGVGSYTPRGKAPKAETIDDIAARAPTEAVDDSFGQKPADTTPIKKFTSSLDAQQYKDFDGFYGDYKSFFDGEGFSRQQAQEIYNDASKAPVTVSRSGPQRPQFELDIEAAYSRNDLDGVQKIINGIPDDNPYKVSEQKILDGKRGQKPTDSITNPVVKRMMEEAAKRKASALEVKRPTATPKTETAAKPADPLEAEARKYKSADEFVKANGRLYHGGAEKWDTLKSGRGMDGEGIYLTSKPERATMYGSKDAAGSVRDAKVQRVALNDARILDGNKTYTRADFPNATGEAATTLDKIFNYYTDGLDGESLALQLRGSSSNNDIARQLGFDAIQKGDDTIVINPAKVMSEKQLTDLYNQATAKPDYDTINKSLDEAKDFMRGMLDKYKDRLDGKTSIQEMMTPKERATMDSLNKQSDQHMSILKDEAGAIDPGESKTPRTLKASVADSGAKRQRIKDKINKETEWMDSSVTKTSKPFSENGKLYRIQQNPYDLNSKPVKKPVEYVYRAVSAAEMESIKKNGYIKSNGNMNLDSENAAGLTVFKDSDPSFYLPKDGGHILKVKVDPKNGLYYDDTDGYVKTPNKIPANQIVEIDGGGNGKKPPTNTAQPASEPDKPRERVEFKTRGFLETVFMDPNTPTKVKQQLIKMDTSYATHDMKQLQIRASNLIKSDIDTAIRIAKADDGDMSAMVGSELIKHYNQSNQVEQAIDMAHLVAKNATAHGQASAALAAYAKLTPEGILRFTQREIARYNKDNKMAKGKELTLKPERAKRLTDQAKALQKMPEGHKKDVATAKMLRDAKEALPTPWTQKVATLQTIAQLLNPKTLIRNVGGNTMFSALENESQVLGAGIDATVSKLFGTKRQVGLPSAKAQAKGFAKGLHEGYDEALAGVSIGPKTQYELGNERTFRKGPIAVAEKAMNVALRATDKAAFTAARDDWVRATMKAQGIKNPTPELTEQAQHLAEYRTFQDDSLAAQTFVQIKKGLNFVGFKAGTGKNEKRFGLGDLILKYPKTPGNLMARGMDYSGGGIIKAMFEVSKPMMGREFDSGKFSMNLARGLVGATNLVGAGAVLGALGIITTKPEEDRDLRDLQKKSGQGGYQINVSAMKRFVLSGFDKAEAELREGDQLVSYDWAQPAAIPLSVGAALGRGDSASKGATATIDNTAEGINTMVEQPMLRGIQQFFGYGRSITDSFKKTAESAPASFVPTLSSQINQLTDNTQRNTYSPTYSGQVINNVKNKIPGLANDLPEAVDALGDTKERYQGGSNNFFNVLLNPAFVSRYKPSKEAQLALDIYNRSGETQQAPRVMKTTQKVNGEDIKLTPEQNRDFQRYVGTQTKQVFSQLMADAGFTNLSDTEKANKINTILTDVTKAGKIEILGDTSKPTGRQAEILNGEAVTIPASDKSGSASKPGTVKTTKAPKAPKAAKTSKGSTAARRRAWQFPRSQNLRVGSNYTALRNLVKNAKVSTRNNA